jgi:hypothetical protein
VAVFGANLAHIEAHACKLGCKGIVFEAAARLALPLRPFASLGEGQKPESAGRGGLR